jgi:ABC transport system ATP-binding/permease protein
VTPRWHQVEVLAERYLEIVLADTGNTALLLLQAPLIAGCIVLVWRDVAQPTDACYFVMALTAVWFGAINACREIVKERTIYLRERMVGQDATAYLLSKLVVLALLGFAQCLALVVVVDRGLALGGYPLLHFVALYAASLSGTTLGLCLSAAVTTSERAITGVPLLLLPQILFSDVILSHEHASNLVHWLEDTTLTAWAYDALKQVIAPELSVAHLAGDVLMLMLLGGALGGLALLIVHKEHRHP